MKKSYLYFGSILVLFAFIHGCGDANLENEMTSFQDEIRDAKSLSSSEGGTEFLLDLTSREGESLVCGAPSIFSSYVSCTFTTKSDGCYVTQHYRNCLVTSSGATCADVGGTSVFCPKGPSYTSGGDLWGGEM